MAAARICASKTESFLALGMSSGILPFVNLWSGWACRICGRAVTAAVSLSASVPLPVMVPVMLPVSVPVMVLVVVPISAGSGMGVVPAIFDADGAAMLDKSSARLLPTKLLLGVACAPAGLVDALPGPAVVCAGASALASALASASASALVLALTSACALASASALASALSSASALLDDN